MPTYDFRCQTCRAERPVTTSHEEAVTLSLVCTRCGGTMVKVPSSFTVLTRVGAGGDRPGTLSPGDGHPARHHHLPGQRCGTCADAVSLDRPNPFADDLPAPADQARPSER